MSISSIISSIAPTNIQSLQATRLQRQDFRGIAQALQAGDLSGAQQAYSDLQAMTSANASSGSPATATNPIRQDFTTLGQDLTAGNLSQARSDFAQMKTDIQSVLSHNGGSLGVQHHGHHGHHRQEVDASSSQSNTLATSSLFSQYASTADNSTADSLLSLIG
jgi:hypothetical protein